MNRRLVALAVAALLLLAVPTAAVTVSAVVSSSDPVVAENDRFVELAPHSGPNGQYASIAGGELEVEFSRLNAEAETAADDVFTITSTAQEPVEVWVTVEDPAVDVYRGDQPANSFDEQSNAVELGPGETVAVGFEVDTHGGTPSADSLTVHVADPDEGGSGTAAPVTDTPDDETPTEPGETADFEVTDLDAPTNLTAGETATVVATVENRGSADGEYTAQLEVDGVIVDQRAVAVPADERRTVRFERTFDRPGTYEVAVGDERATVTVTAADGGENETTAGNGSLSVVDVRVDEGRIAPNGETTVLATVRNDGDARGTFAVNLAVAGVELETQTVTLDPGEERTLRFDRSFTEAGVYTVAVNGMTGGEVTVAEPGLLSDRELPSDVQTAAVAPVALGLLLAVGLRRRR